MDRHYIGGMTLRRPITPANRAPDRLVGEAALREPSTGSLGWMARVTVILLLSALLWSIVVGLVKLIP